MLGEFVNGLAAVIGAADHLRRLPSDRLNRLLHCIGDAMRRTEAFTPMSSGRGYAWNHPFMAECRHVMRERLSLRLPPSVEAGLSGGIRDVCRWFMGMELRDIDLMRLKKIQTASDVDPNFLFMKRLTDVFDRRLVIDVARQQTTLAGVCGALADANPENRLREIAAWILHCCDICLPGVDGADLGHAQAFRSIMKVPRAQSGAARTPNRSSDHSASVTRAAAREREASMPWTAG